MKSVNSLFHRTTRRHTGLARQLLGMDALEDAGIEPADLDKLLDFLDGKLSDEDFARVMDILDPSGTKRVGEKPGNPTTAMDSKPTFPDGNRLSGSGKMDFPHANRLKG